MQPQLENETEPRRSRREGRSTMNGEVSDSGRGSTTTITSFLDGVRSFGVGLDPCLLVGVCQSVGILGFRLMDTSRLSSEKERGERKGRVGEREKWKKRTERKEMRRRGRGGCTFELSISSLLRFLDPRPSHEDLADLPRSLSSLPFLEIVAVAFLNLFPFPPFISVRFEMKNKDRIEYIYAKLASSSAPPHIY